MSAPDCRIPAPDMHQVRQVAEALDVARRWQEIELDDRRQVDAFLVSEGFHYAADVVDAAIELARGIAARAGGVALGMAALTSSAAASSFPVCTLPAEADAWPMVASLPGLLAYCAASAFLAFLGGFIVCAMMRVAKQADEDAASSAGAPGPAWIVDDWRG